jgi:type IV pilus assembly protein PilW
MNTLRTRYPRSSAGFTMVEIMIGLLIGVIGIVVIMQVYAVSEGYKRTATTGTDAQINGAVGLYQIERDLRISGFGLTAMMSGPQGCSSIRMFDASANKTYDIKMTPFDINPATLPPGDPNTDVLMMLYGSSGSAIIGNKADQANLPTDPIRVTSNANAYRNGDLVIAYQKQAGPGNTPVCTIRELTAVPSGDGNCGAPVPGNNSSRLVAIGTGTYPNPNDGCKIKQAKYNHPTGITMTSGAPVPPMNEGIPDLLISLGSNTQWKAYAIRNGNLTFCDLMVKDCSDVNQWDVIAQDVVSLRVIYATNTGQWTRVGIVGGNTASNIRGVAVALVARSSLKEKPKGAAGCDATNNPDRPDSGQPNPWYQQYMGNTDGTIVGAAINLSTTSPDWQCYRYKLFQTAVPVRNLQWKP